ncbi:MAG: flagellar L-ring protein precursor FlgH [Limisphaerales bacterium]|jgi:flagellar L-ring protein precursor FlgH
MNSVQTKDIIGKDDPAVSNPNDSTHSNNTSQRPEWVLRSERKGAHGVTDSAPFNPAVNTDFVTRWASWRALVIVLAFHLVAASAGAASLWHAETSRGIISDQSGNAVGDIITIIIQETSSTTKDKNTKTAKKSATDMSIQSFLFAPQASSLLNRAGNFPAVKYGTSKSFDGGGAIKNSEQMTARIAVRVIDKLPNGNLVIEGRRMTSFSEELQEMVLRGVVRKADVSANNTVFSYNIADANISFISKGSLSTEQKKGWFTKFFDKVTPF